MSEFRIFSFFPSCPFRSSSVPFRRFLCLGGISDTAIKRRQSVSSHGLPPFLRPLETLYTLLLRPYLWCTQIVRTQPFPFPFPIPFPSHTNAARSHFLRFFLSVTPGPLIEKWSERLPTFSRRAALPLRRSFRFEEAPVLLLLRLPSSFADFRFPSFSGDLCGLLKRRPLGR